MGIEYNFVRLVEAWCRLHRHDVVLGKMPRRMKKAKKSYVFRRDTKAKRRLYAYLRRKLIELNIN